MKVLTLDAQALQTAARALEKKAQAFAPDLVVGIATGGEIVAEMMFEGVPHIYVKSRRRSTAAKQRIGWVWTIVRHLPRCVKDAMRVAEARRLSHGKGKMQEPMILGADTQAAIAGSKKILVVDDAIDSGMTMKRVVDAIRGVEGSRDIAVAAITETMKEPLVVADYKLYCGVLVRFPWSKDFKA